MKVLRKVRSVCWRYQLKLRGAQVGRNFQVLGSLDALLRDGAVFSNLIIGNNVTLGGKTYIRMRKDGKIILRDGVRTGTDVWLVTANDAELIVGTNSILGSYSIFNGGHGLNIGAHCIFAAFVYINTSDHGFKKGELIQKQGFVGAPIEIGDDVWLGGHLFINKGVKIGNGAVVGAGAVVTKDVPEYKIAAGNPAQVLRDRE